MPQKGIKEADNPCHNAQMKAAVYKYDRRNSRKGAAEIVCTEQTRLTSIERGSINSHHEEVNLLSNGWERV